MTFLPVYVNKCGGRDIYVLSECVTGRSSFKCLVGTAEVVFNKN